ncbi:MAG: hydrogenase expression/formation protein HypE [Gammaproteobacteria bacterium]
MQDTHISLAHGNGGRFMRELIEELFAQRLSHGRLDPLADAVAIDLPEGVPVVTTDGFSVQPLEFPGGNLGSLAVHGATNDLAVAGAIPRYLTLSAFIEEGFEVAALERIVDAMAAAAREIEVEVVAGDTKVVPRGHGGGVYFACTAVGTRDSSLDLTMQGIRMGDVLMVSGSVGDHGTAVMLAREQFGLRGDLQSDSGSVLAFTRALLDVPGLRFMRDPTRGGLATVGHEIAHATGLEVHLNENDIPVKDPVRSVCEMLGYDPYFLACEGRVVAVVASDQAETALARWRALPGGDEAAIIGHVVNGRPSLILHTEIGGERVLEELEDDPLPRIC